MMPQLGGSDEAASMSTNTLSPAVAVNVSLACCPAAVTVSVTVVAVSPYDVILSSPGERDALRDWHRDWLSTHPSGL